MFMQTYSAVSAKLCQLSGYDTSVQYVRITISAKRVKAKLRINILCLK